jgi:hypothetical protein
MALSDLIIKAKINVAFARDPRVGVLDIGVHSENGIVTLDGDVDAADECTAAEEIARGVDGVRQVISNVTCGEGQKADTAELVIQRFMEKLDEEWNDLPEKTALAQADYLRWALWMVYKFRIPHSETDPELLKAEAEATEEALGRIAGNVGIPKVIAALEMIRQEEMVSESSKLEAPALGHSLLVATSVVDGGNPAVSI